MGNSYKWGGITDSPAETLEPTSNVTVGEGTGTITYSGDVNISLTKEQFLAGVAEEEVAGIRLTTDTNILVSYLIPDSMRGFDEPPVRSIDLESSFDIPVEEFVLVGDFYFSISNYEAGKSEHTFTWQILRKGE